VSLSDKFTPGVRAGVLRCKRDGAVLRREIGPKVRDLVEIGLAEGDDGMIALTEVGKIVWTLLQEILKLDEAVARMRKARVASLEEMRDKIVCGEPELDRKSLPPRDPDPISAARAAAAFRQGDMTCGTSNTDSFEAFLRKLPPDRNCHRRPK
jgi:hypothetical protein